VGTNEVLLQYFLIRSTGRTKQSKIDSFPLVSAFLWEPMKCLQFYL
jgi:hypothetical protein